jgi:hypothetical protein
MTAQGNGPPPGTLNPAAQTSDGKPMTQEMIEAVSSAMIISGTATPGSAETTGAAPVDFQPPQSAKEVAKVDIVLDLN